jgi:hypothetical protein
MKGEYHISLLIRMRVRVARLVSRSAFMEYTAGIKKGM